MREGKQNGGKSQVPKSKSKQTPNPKIQISNKSQILNPKLKLRALKLGFGICLGFGIWNLGFGFRLDCLSLEFARPHRGSEIVCIWFKSWLKEGPLWANSKNKSRSSPERAEASDKPSL